MENIINRMKKMNEDNFIPQRSAWNRGLKQYASELLEDIEERAEYEGHFPKNTDELADFALNGADDWYQYSWGGCSLIYDRDIAERLCTPSELKRTRHGEKDPNDWEKGWLDTQARALLQAYKYITKMYKKAIC